MFEYLRRVLSTEQNQEFSHGGNSASSGTAITRYQVASAALLIEIARADGEFTEGERNRIIGLMKKDFSLDDECVNELFELSEREVKSSISVYEFSSIINQNFSREEKTILMKNLWRIIYEDGKLDSHEDRMVKIIGRTLNLEHKDIIGTKLSVKKEMGKQDDA